MLPVVIAVVLGALLALCGLPYAWSYLTPVPLAVLFAFTAGAPSARAGAARLFWAGLAFFTLTLYWLPESFGAGIGWFGVAMFVPLYALEAGFWALLAWLCLRGARRFEGRVLLLAFGWVVLEWLKHLGQIAFPWGALGYTLLPLPVVQIADLGGVLLLSLLVTFTAAALALAARGHFRPLLASVAVWAGSAVYGVTRPELVGEPGRALLLRTNFNSFDKARGVGGLLGASVELTRHAEPGELPIWSESVVGVYDEGHLQEQLRGVGVDGRPLLIGAGFPGRNSALAWDQRIVGEYDKMQLVPFGEFYPFKVQLRGVYEWIYGRMLGIPFSPPEPGRVAAPLTLDGRDYGTYICYDSVFGGVAAALVRGGADVLVNVSNDGFYNDSVGVEQHFQMGRLRAIETRRYVLRSVNRGVAAVVDERGRVRQRLDVGEGAMHAEFEFLGGRTLYVRFGDVPVLLLCGLGVLWALLLDRKKRRGG